MIQIRVMRLEETEEPSGAARRLLYSALKAEGVISETEIQVEKDEKGKPCLKDYPDIFISISHSGPYVACAFGDKPVGVDIEMWKEHRQWRRIVDKLHPREREWIRGFCGGEITEKTKEPVQAFCDLWVRKESFLKAIGEGLRVPLGAFDTMGAVVEQKLRPEDYQVKNYRIPGEKVSMAVCAQAGEPPQEMEIRYKNQRLFAGSFPEPLVK